MLSPVLAQQIAGETTEAIGHNVIITDADAIVIGSGDPTRVGTLHEASVEVMLTQESAWHTPDQARQLRGVRPGITLPLVLAGEAVGTVGITGSPRQVRRFGLLVRRQTEILLEESALVRVRLLRERALEDLAAEVVAFTADASDPELLEEAAHELGFTLQLPRRPLLVEVETAAAPIGPEFLRAVRAVFHHRQDMVARRSTVACLVLMHVDSRSARDEAQRLIEGLEERFSYAVAVGLGDVAQTLEGLAQACGDAPEALVLGRNLHGHDGRVHLIEELRVHQALASLPLRARQRLVQGAWRDLAVRSDWPVMRETVMAWVESGFHLVDAAAALTIHRNTLVYRLEKVEGLLGHPWRDHRAMLALYVACLAPDASGKVR